MIAWPRKFLKNCYFRAHFTRDLATHGRHSPEQDAQCQTLSDTIVPGPLFLLVFCLFACCCFYFLFCFVLLYVFFFFLMMLARDFPCVVSLFTGTAFGSNNVIHLPFPILFIFGLHYFFSFCFIL